jgi:hypothetical protein
LYHTNSAILFVYMRGEERRGEERRGEDRSNRL